jgi:hypothetical protein
MIARIHLFKLLLFVENWEELQQVVDNPFALGKKTK